jgi:hypothetical protein
MITIGCRTMTRPEWMLPDGTFPYEKQALAARNDLKAIAKGLDRMAENDANPQLEAVATPRRESPSTDGPVFAKSTNYPNGRGGF